MKKKLAIFDIDGTIFRSSLLIEFVELCIREGVFDEKTSLAYRREHQAWLDRKGSYEDYIASVVQAFFTNLKGVHYHDFKRVADEVIALHKNRVYRFTRDLVKDLKKKGYYLAAISHSPKELVEPFAKHLGFNKVYGTVYALDAANRKFSGELRFKDIILDKAKIVQRILEREAVTLRGSIGVGDTESDIRFLNLVDRPICFNPNKKLFATARRRGWRIVVERKDVIYKM
jgi:HAD superfamily hydrolase (TIGR01490 family)